LLYGQQQPSANLGVPPPWGAVAQQSLPLPQDPTASTASLPWAHEQAIPSLFPGATNNQNSAAATAVSARMQSESAAFPRLQPESSAGIPMARDTDLGNLSEYQMLVREQLEFFESNESDADTITQGRKKKILLGQVGIRCIHCRGMPLRARGKASVYYPAKLSGVYQASQNMASNHLISTCSQIPDGLRAKLIRLRDRKDTARGGKQYWADSCVVLGLYDDGTRIWRRNSNTDTQSPLSTQV
jgi:hypothetical protein